ncbi:MAG: DNA polymerase/3'-5' exonuclease PolX [Phycisphaeraceae bacterium]|nr:DNA polymerase/3'-5' exonuclease PolX [Phycisphaeraceae bacterium]MCP4797045.1 DNA polymerase/3'-5' exonuclease PolX [Phycisphaeraceae bacterium]
MSSNEDIGSIFEEMATLLELTGANGFRVNAHTKVARVVEGLSSDLAEVARGEKGLAELQKIDGIGKSSAEKIVAFVATGTVPELEDLRSEVPDGLRTVMQVPGLGPKTVRRFWQEASVESLADLEAALDDGRLEALPRMGRKTLDNIRASIDFMKSAGDRRRLGDAMPLAERVVAVMEAVPGMRRVAWAGSLRRGQETIGDVDILVSTDDPEAASTAFREQPGVSRVLVAGETKSSVRLEEGIQVDLRVVPEEVWGATLMYFTGSKDHNVALRERAIARGLRLNEYGLFPEDDEATPPQQRGIAPVAASTEAEIYEALELPWIPPELRVDRDEFDRPIPGDLVTVEAIRAELHSHTTASDGKLSIDELAAAAMAGGREILAITDHSRSSAQANGLDVDRLRRHADAIREADARIDGIRLLAGSEVDIHADGSLDYEDDVLAMLDVVVASPHASLRQEPAVATARLCAAARHPLVSIIGHPTGRIIGSRKGLEPDIEAVIAAAIEGGTALEINSNPLRLDLRDIHVRAAVEAGCLISINTDAHRAEHLEFIRYGVLTGRRGRLEAEGCINTWAPDRLLPWLARNR